MRYKITLVNGDEEIAEIPELFCVAQRQVFKVDMGVQIGETFYPAVSILKMEKL